MSSEAVIEKVRKLRALATSTNAHEAAAAAAAADRLIQEHRLAEAELHAEAPEAATDGGTLYTEKVTCRWRSSLAAAITRHYGCFALHVRVVDGKALRIFGTSPDIELVRYMYAWLSTEAERLVKLAGVSGRTSRNSWFFGFVAGIVTQIDASTKETAAAATQAGRGAGLVHLVTARQRGEALCREIYQNIRKGAPTRFRVDSDAYGEGKRAGAELHLGKGLAARPGRLLGIGG